MIEDMLQTYFTIECVTLFTHHMLKSVTLFTLINNIIKSITLLMLIFNQECMKIYNKRNRNSLQPRRLLQMGHPRRQAKPGVAAPDREPPFPHDPLALLRRLRQRRQHRLREGSRQPDLGLRIRESRIQQALQRHK